MQIYSLLIAVASLCRFPEAISVWLCALWTETDWWRSAWRLKLGECTCKSIPLLIAVASLCRYPDAIACLVVRSLDRDGLVEVSVEIKIR